METNPKHRYRPEIDGLRCIAVLIVVMFHLELACGGGFVGVDVFFVISGYLITSIIRRDVERGQFSFLNFWCRRVRRILPAAMTMTVVVLSLGYLWLLPDDLNNLASSALGHSAMVANLYFWRTTGYFAGAAEEKPLLHTWSLAVEEQFYLFLPICLVWLLRNNSSVPGKQFKLAAIATLVSFSLSLYGTSAHPVATFYLLPFRAWELLIGVSIALLPPQESLSRIKQELMSFGGLAAIFIASLLYSKATPFPGMAALLPCLGAAAFIYSNTRDSGAPPTISGGVLGWLPFRFIGLISYSTYLWHWPVIVFFRYTHPGDLTTENKFRLLSLSLAAGVGSWILIETPFRKQFKGVSRRSTILCGCAVSFAVAAFSVFVTQNEGLPGRFGASTLTAAQAKNDIGFVSEATRENIEKDELPSIGVIKESPPDFMIWGDSHAMSMMPAIDQFLVERKLTGLVATHSSTPPVLNWHAKTKYGLDEDAPAFGGAVLKSVFRNGIKNVVLISFWTRYAKQDTAGFAYALVNTVQTLRSRGVNVWIILDVPKHSINIPIAVARARASKTSLNDLMPQVDGYIDLEFMIPGSMTEIRRLGAFVIDPKPEFLSRNRLHYICQKDERILYRDDQHLTTDGAMKILLPLLDKSLTIPDAVQHDPKVGASKETE